MDYTFISEKLYTLLEQHDNTEYDYYMKLKRCKSYMDKLTAGKVTPEILSENQNSDDV